MSGISPTYPHELSIQDTSNVPQQDPINDRPSTVHQDLKGTNPHITSHDSSLTTFAAKVGPPTIHAPVIDSGATGHFFTTTAPVINKTVAVHKIPVSLPDGSTIYNSHEAELNIHTLPPEARKCYIYPDLQNTLISIGVFCDAGCQVIFDRTRVRVIKNGDTILTGTRDTSVSKLWHLDEPDLGQHSANTVLGLTAKAKELVQFSHAALFSPTIKTLAQALSKGYVAGFPGLTVKTLRRHRPSTAFTDAGHLDQQRQNLRSTRTTVTESDNDKCHFPAKAHEDRRTHVVLAAVHSVEGLVYSDQTGAFPEVSVSGYKHILVVYEYDSNYIFVEPMKSKTAAAHVLAFEAVLKRLKTASLKPVLHRLDNECSALLKDFMADESIAYELTPAGMHRRNAAERAIRTFKNHFIAGLASCDPNFPLNLWDRLLDQAERTLNLLRGSRINPKLSAYMQIHGAYDFARHPMAPPGTKVLAHVKPKERDNTWGRHAVEGWYIGPSFEHYRCYRVWVPTTTRERICDTVIWYPRRCPIPTVTTADLVLAAARDLLQALQTRVTDSPLATLTDSQVAALRELSRILHNSALDNDDPNVLPPDTAISTGTQTIPTTASTETQTVSTSDCGTDPATSLSDPPSPVSVGTSPAVPATPLRVPAPPVVTPDRPAPVDPGWTLARDRQRRNRQPSHRANIIFEHPALPGVPALLTPDISVPHAAFHAVNPDTGKPAEYRELCQSSEGAEWVKVAEKEFDQLLEGTKAIVFIPVHELPRGAQCTYCRIAAHDTPHKPNPRRIRFAVGGDRIVYDGPVTAPTGELTTAKLLINSVLSTPGARMMTLDIKDYYPMCPMDEPAFMRIRMEDIPPSIVNRYNLNDVAHKGYVYVRINHALYGLPQAGRIAHDYLAKHLAKHGYHPTGATPGLFRHDTRPIWFLLVVDDFAVKYTARADVQHLLDAIHTVFPKTIENWDGDEFLKLKLEWDYARRTCDVSLPGYIEKALRRFQHPPPTRRQDSPYQWTPPSYGARIQPPKPADTTPALAKDDLTRLQQVIGTILYYARAVDHTMLAALSDLASEQSKGTEATLDAATRLLNYCASHPDAVIRYHASDMILHVHSDGSYLSATMGRSRTAGFHYLSTATDTHTKPEQPPAPLNGPILVTSKILRAVVSSAFEIEVAAIYNNAKDACPLRQTLIELGHPQPPTPIQTDNATANGFANDNIKQRHSRAIDMRFYWVKDRARQKQFVIHWKPGSQNHADYWSKHHPASVHREKRSLYLHEPTNIA